ncbi:hypothetical protein [Tardiphaga sp.]|jgi:hypothetical protein|uniref:hypothetical protein n=1 Tax=Tardiphaga sp. TaxID=1926292 RepID=UPI0037DA2A27
MDARLNQTIARIRKDIRLLSREMLALIDADEDCSQPAQQIMRAQADLRLYIEKRERV